MTEAAPPLPGALADAPAVAGTAAKATRYAYVVAVVLAVVYTFNFLDRQFLTVLQEDVKRDLRLNDAQLGMLTGLMFALFYTSCGVPIAALADRFNRVRIVTIASATWSLFTALCGFAGSFAALAAARVCVGVGEAGGSPPSYSVLSDYFPREQRGRALAIYSLGVPLGSMFGTLCGGFIAQAFGWRAAFWSLGLAGLALTPLIPLAVREPVRGAADGPRDPDLAAHEPKPGMFSAVGAFARSPALMLTALAAGLTAFVGYGMLNWNASLLIRVKGASKADVALWYGLLTGAANVAGTFASGLIVDRWGRRDPAGYALAPGIAILLSAPFLWGAVLAPSWPAAVAFLIGPALLNNMYLAPALAVVQNGAPARHRGAAGALLLFVLNLIGLGGGPFFVGVISDALRPKLGAAAALQHAMLWLTPVFGLAFLCQLAAAAALRRRPAP